MCIIFVKEKGVQLPGYETFKNMVESNPHGNGFAYLDTNSKKVVIRKGFMSLDEYYQAITEIPNATDVPIVGHSRITTHGTTSKGNCHPFPISSKNADLKATKIETDLAIIHNGIIPLKQNTNDIKADLSDTMSYIKNTLYPRYKANKYFYKSEKMLKQIEQEIQSKMVFFNNRGEIVIANKQLFIEDNGIFYSNDSYLSWEYDNFYYGKNKKYDDEDYNDMIAWENGLVWLEPTDYIKLNGETITGSEIELYLAYDGVYYLDIETGEYQLVTDVAYSKNNIEIDYYERCFENGIEPYDEGYFDEFHFENYQDYENYEEETPNKDIDLYNEYKLALVK